MNESEGPWQRMSVAAQARMRGIAARAAAWLAPLAARLRRASGPTQAGAGARTPLLERLSPHQRIVAASIAVAVVVGAGLWIALDAVDPLPAKKQTAKAPDPPPQAAPPPAAAPSAGPAANPPANPAPNPPPNPVSGPAPQPPVQTPGAPAPAMPRGNIAPSIVRQMDTQPLAAVRQYAEAGEVSAQVELGRRYYQGIGVDRNPAEAAAWIERAALQGDANAQFNIGVLYEQGIGVKRDLAKAIDWYNKAAAQNMPLAMHNLAMLYHRGEGLERNLVEVRRLLLQASELGLVQSQFSLALVYEQGVGGPVDKVAALAWLSLAARSNDEKIIERLQKMSREALPADVEAARQLAVRLGQGIVELRRAQDARNQPQANYPAPPPNMPTLSTAMPPPASPNGAKADTKGDAKTNATGDVKNGDGEPPTKAMVSEVQRLLATLKLYAGPVTGSLGPQTQKAVREFQAMSGLPEDGKITADLVATLREVAAAAGQPKRR